MQKLSSRLFWATYLTVGLWMLVVPPASAYLDPGTGSMVIQAVVGGAMAAGLILKTQWRRIKNLFSREESETSVTVDE